MNISLLRTAAQFFFFFVALSIFGKDVRNVCVSTNKRNLRLLQRFKIYFPVLMIGRGNGAF